MVFFPVLSTIAPVSCATASTAPGLLLGASTVRWNLLNVCGFPVLRRISRGAPSTISVPPSELPPKPVLSTTAVDKSSSSASAFLAVPFFAEALLVPYCFVFRKLHPQIPSLDSINPPFSFLGSLLWPPLLILPTTFFILAIAV